MDKRRTRIGPLIFTVPRGNPLTTSCDEATTTQVRSATTPPFVNGRNITRKTLGVFLFFWVVIFSLPLLSDGLIYEKCENRTAKSGRIHLGVDKSTLNFAVVLAGTEKDDNSEKCDRLNWRNVRNLLAIQWVVNKLNKPNHDNQTFIPGYDIDFYVFDDCGQPTICFKHIADILEPSVTTQLNQCPNIPNSKQPSIFGILTLDNASLTNTILEVSKMSSIPVINPQINLNSFQRYKNFIGLSPLIDFEVQAILRLLQKLEWTYTGIIYSSTESARQMKNRLMSDSLNHGICFAFNVNTSDVAQVELAMENAIKQTKSKHLGIVYLGDGSDMQTIFKKKTSKIHWIVFDSFGGHFKTFQTIPNLLKGVLTICPVNIDVDAFETLYTQKIQGSSSSQHASESIDEWISDLLYQTNQNLGNIPAIDILKDDASSVMDAVYVLATVIKEMCSKNPINCQKSNIPYSHKNTIVDYSTMVDFSPIEFQEQNRTITILNNIVRSEKSPKTILNILNFWDGKFTKVGTLSRNYHLNVSLNAIKMTNEKGNEVNGNNLPKSLCSQVCEECQQPEFKGIISYIPGDILLLGIFSIHDTGPSFQCGKFRKDSTDAIASEAFLYTVKQLPRITSNITVGAILIDDCYNSIQASMNISLILSGKKKLFDPSTGEVINPEKIVAIIGPLASGVTKSLADLLTHEKMLMISYAASSHDLDDKISYPYFLRTVPSDVQQVNAIVSLLIQLNWRYVGIIYANNNYGAKAKEIFLASAKKNNICVPAPKVIEESDVKAKSSEIENTLDDLMKDQVKIVVYFGTNSRVAHLVQALKRKSIQNRFVFIGCEAWGVTYVNDLKTVAGSITLTLDGSKTADTGQFREYLTKRTLESDAVDNPFFNMFWYNFHKCDPPNGFRNVYNKACIGSERFSSDDAKKFAYDQRSVHTMNAVFTVFEGIKKFQNVECKYIVNEIPCARYKTHVKEFVAIMKTIKLKGYDDLFEVFDEDGNGRVPFNIHNIQRRGSEYIYELVGNYNMEYSPVLRIGKLRFYDNRLQQHSYINVTCVSPYTCCDPVKPTASASMDESSIRTVDTVILSLLCVLFVLLIALVICYVLREKQRSKQQKPSPERSEFQDKTITANGQKPISTSPKRPPTVYIRSGETVDAEAYNGIVTYQIMKTQQEGVHQLTPISHQNTIPNHSNGQNAFNNDGFESDNAFLFPDTISQSPSTSYEEVASPRILEQAKALPPRPAEILNNHKTDNPILYSNGDIRKSTFSRDEAFII